MINKRQYTGKVGKPRGTRLNLTLHAEILWILEQDQKQNGDGMTAFAISKAVAASDPTTRLYISDLVEEKKIVVKTIAGMTLYQLSENIEKD